uniref:transcription factor EMB1444-like isoform X2 n=1 Tax=Erigeron canadensis TaxID=72917 RepID=UPI001CB954B6|nr:transcription factor EMB1444-like isoform X2 [Erigeron canadensis]
MVGGELHQQLKNLCFNTDWNYAVFWKLEHQPRMLLTWEGAYYDNNEKHNRSKINWTSSMDDELGTQDLGLAIARMSNRIYSVGEGIVGRVAATGTHLWISEHQLVNSSCSLDKTVLFVAVGQYGVIELGSLDTITEDMNLVKHIREIFLEIQSFIMASTDCSPCVTDLSTTSGSVRSHTYVNEDRVTREKNRSDMWTAVTVNNHQKLGNPKSVFTKSASCKDQNLDWFRPACSNDQMINISETNYDESFKFPAGYELFEALGPAFCKQNNSYNSEMMTAETLTVYQMPEETSASSHLTQISGAENLLEAVVASVYCNYNDENLSKSLEQLQRPHEQAKVGKKRARPGESRKPRPRDRQLIQDRLKELRQLVPSGSKCSIDSLLERTIKHMHFMQCIMKHTNKIDQSADFKLAGKETDIQPPSIHEQGSSWAIEVGDQLKVCPIVVENIGIDGQMLVEIMSVECVNFLEITEALRSMGLTILKGVTDVHGDNNWMCFIVEVKNNRSIHRVDILLSLIQILESKRKT